MRLSRNERSKRALEIRQDRNRINRGNHEAFLSNKLSARGLTQNADGVWVIGEIKEANVYKAVTALAQSAQKPLRYDDENLPAYLIDRGWIQCGPLNDVWKIPMGANFACFTLRNAYKMQMKLDANVPDAPVVDDYGYSYTKTPKKLNQRQKRARRRAGYSK